MGSVMLTTANHPWVKLKATNFSGSFGTQSPTLVKPSGDGVIDMLKGAAAGGPVQNALLLKFFGTDASDEAFNCRVWGIDRCRVAVDGDNFSWESTLLAQFAVTLGNVQGTAGCAIGSSDFEADTIVLTYGNDDIDVSINSPANDVRGAYARLDSMGFSLVKIEFDMNSSAASANCLYRKL